MASIIASILSWLGSRVMIYLMILGVLLGIFVVTTVPPMVVAHHEAELERAIDELGQTKELVGELKKRADGISETIDAKNRQLRELNEQRESIERLWETVKGLFNRSEARKKKEAIAKKERELRNEVRELALDRNQLRIEGGESEEEVKRKEFLRDEKEAQLREIQEMRAKFDSLMRNQLRQIALVALGFLAVITLVPLVWKLGAFYILAPIAQRSKPILLGVERPDSPEISASSSNPAQRIMLADGEVLMTKADYLQGSMGDDEKRTKWLMDWRYPFSSIAAGLFMLTLIRNKGEAGGQVTLSSQQDATEELSVVDIPEGRWMVFRPHYLVAVTHPADLPPRIRSKWVFWKLHAWINLQFRYLMVCGPTKLVFSAQRGTQVEEVLPAFPGRRVNSRLTVAFSPHLNYSPMRAETFVSYLRKKSALFDDFFQGSGIVIQQQVTGTKRNPAARLWEGVFGAIGKVFGI